MTGAEEQAILLAELQARRDHAPSLLHRAVWQLCLGEAAESVETLREHAAGLSGDGGPGERRWVPALLTGDWETAEREAGVHLEQFPDAFVAGYAEYMNAMLALIQGNDAAAAGHIDRLRKYVSGRDKFRSRHPSAIAEIPAGVAAGDAARAEAGVEALLEWHLRRTRARSEVFNSALGVICLDAIVALLVAHRHGLTVNVSPKYRSARVPMLAVHLNEWNGQPIERGLKLSFETDLVAAPWLAERGLDLGEVAPPSAPRGGIREATRRSLGPGELEPDVVADHLRGRLDNGRGSPWQLVGWALMLGDPERARQLLRGEADAARARWEESSPWQGNGKGLPSHSSELSNPNHVRDHLGLALVLGDEEAIRVTSGLLRTWMDGVEREERARRAGEPAKSLAYLFPHHLLFVSRLLEPTAPPPTREAAQAVWLPLANVTCVGLLERDAVTVERGLNGMLKAHAQGLERRTSPPAPLSDSAMQLAVVARRLGIPAATDERYASYPVPIVIHHPPGSPGAMGRLPCDLMGTALWA